MEKKIFEIEVNRTNTTAKQFYSYCKRALIKKGYAGMPFDFDEWANPEEYNRKQDKFRLREYEEGLYTYILEFDEANGHGYMYILEIYDVEETEPEATKETTETEPEAEVTETATETEDIADQGETAESVTKQYECENVVQVAHKVADLTNTLCDRETWKGYCDEVKRYGSTWIDYTAFDTGGNEFDVSIFLGYDQQCRHYFVSVDYEKCPVPDMVRGA